MKLLESVRDFCAAHAKNHIYIALSGGLDSRVLLDLCRQISMQSSIQFHVIHIHHGLSVNAEAWVECCREWTEAARFVFHMRTVNINLKDGGSLEEEARNQRYTAFAEIMQQDDLLLTAHHQDDQAETVLLQLLRGAGPKGLAAMPSCKQFANGWHGRPLLQFSRQELREYAVSHDLKWIEDESNFNLALTRNFIRHEVLSLLKSRWPNIENTLTRSAQHCAEAQGLLEETAREKLPLASGSQPDTLSAAKLNHFNPSWQRLLLRVWIEDCGFRLPDANKIYSIQESVLASAWDRTPCVSWEGAEVRRHRDDIYIISPSPENDIQGNWEWDMAQPLNLPCGRVLTAEMMNGCGLHADIGNLSVRYRIQGETVTIGSRGRVSLKNLLQEWRVPVWERGRLSLVFAGEKLVMVPGYYVEGVLN